MQSEISSPPTTKQLQNHKWEILHCSIIFTAGDNSNRTILVLWRHSVELSGILIRLSEVDPQQQYWGIRTRHVLGWLLSPVRGFCHRLRMAMSDERSGVSCQDLLPSFQKDLQLHWLFSIPRPWSSSERRSYITAFQYPSLHTLLRLPYHN